MWFVTDAGFDWLRKFGSSFRRRSTKVKNLQGMLRAVASFAGSNRKATLENSRNKAEESMTENAAFSAWVEARRRGFIQGV